MEAEIVFSAALSKLLEPTETVIFAAEVLPDPADTSQLSTRSIPRRRTATATRYVALVTNETNGVESAARVSPAVLSRIMLLKRPSSPVLVAVVPILASFRLSISQTSLLSPTLARTGFIVTFSSPPSAPTSILAEDLSPLSFFLSEIRRLGKKALHEGGSTHAWMDAYEVQGGEGDGESLKRFDSISSAYSMRVSKPYGLRTGLDAIDWRSTVPDALNTSSSAAQVADGRGRWIIDHIQARDAEFTQKEDIKIFCGTFNVNDKLPTEDLTPWLSGSVGSEIIVLGFQEFDLSTEAMLRYSPYREREWRKAIEKGLEDRAEFYVKVASRQLVGAIIIVYALKTSLPYISSVSYSSVATGILGLMANKGATSIRLRYKDSYLTFVNSHLAAFESMVQKRNQEVVDIGRSLSFPVDGGRDMWAPNLRPEVDRVVGMLGMYDSHHLIWMGDLNYRLDLPRADVERMIENKDWKMLRHFDQLEMQKGPTSVWADFEEATIDFPPTFKFDVGTCIYDTSEKQRTPSWTDRVLWMSIHEGTIKSLSYNSHPEVTISDHKPVSAILSVPVCTIIPEKRLKVQAEVMAELDQYDNDSLPDVKIFPGPAIQFDVIEYLKPEMQSISIVNTGSVLVQWSFIPKPASTTLFEPWLHVFPASGLILPGETSQVNLTIHIDKSTSPSLNFQPRDSLCDLLILSIKRKDLFLSVSAREYLPTCFGNSLSRLARLGEPIRVATSEELRVADEMGGEGSEVPDEMRRMVEFLSEYGLERDDLFEVTGQGDTMKLLRDCLDTGDAFPVAHLIPSFVDPSHDDQTLELRNLYLSYRPLFSPDPLLISPFDLAPHNGIHSMGDSLVRFLDALSEPVVQYSCYGMSMRCETREDAYRVLDSLDTINANVLLYLISFLRILIAQTPETKRAARSDRLAVIFSTVLLKPPPLSPLDGIPTPSIPRRKQAFMQSLLLGPPITYFP